MVFHVRGRIVDLKMSDVSMPVMTREPPSAPAGEPERPCSSYDVVIATRNRPEALALSIPLILAQSRSPAKLIVIDSSDDHAPVAAAVEAAVAGYDGLPVIVEHCRSDPSGRGGRGLPFQRNRGLAHVTGDVVLFPDDDSMLFPEAAARIMEIYDSDTGHRIAAVCAAEAMAPPPGMTISGDYQMTPAHQREARTRSLRNRLEKRFTQLKPTIYLGQLFMARGTMPDWLEAQNCVPVEYMTGFRMSFRTGAIRGEGFDETLRDYALDEDIDASFSAAREGLVVGARNAQIYHHRFPGGRGDARKLGAIAILNRVYVVTKHIHAGGLSPQETRLARSRLRAFVRLKLLTAFAGLRGPHGRERLAGARAAARQVPALMAAPPEQLVQSYRQALSEIGL